MAIPFKTDSGDFGVLNITGSSSADFSAGINSSGANYLERVYFTGADGQWLPVDESADAWTSGSAGKLYYNGGNVGIGTASPSHLLSVSGTTYSQSLFVTGADGSWGQVTTGGGGSVSWDSAPATSTSAGAAGSIAYDSNYYYVCVATNTWKRTSLSSW